METSAKTYLSQVQLELHRFCFNLNKFSFSWENLIYALEDDCCDLFCVAKGNVSHCKPSGSCIGKWNRSPTKREEER